MLNMNFVTGSVVYLSLFFTVLFQLYICVSIFFQKVHYFSIVFAFVVFCKQSFISFHPSSGTTSQMLDDCPLRLVLGFNHISALTKLSLDQCPIRLTLDFYYIPALTYVKGKVGLSERTAKLAVIFAKKSQSCFCKQKQDKMLVDFSTSICKFCRLFRQAVLILRYII